MRMLVLLLLGLALWLPGGALLAEDAPADATLGALRLGDYWWGAHVETAQLEGQVVLFVLWGSCVGCRQMTPHMVGLAKRFEGAPFHLVLSHSQDISSQEEVIAYLRNNKLSAFAPNVTVAKDGAHPALKVGAFRPYYALFDHTGRLVHQGMGGSYNGGDELGMIRRSVALVEQAPALWVGPDPYEHARALAAAVAKGRNLGGTLKKIEADLAREPEAGLRGELERLRDVLHRHCDRQLARAERLVGGRPSEVLPLLEGLAKTFKGTGLAAAVDARLAAHAASADLAKAAALEKDFRKIVKAFERVKEGKRSEALVEKTVAKLEALLEEAGELPFARILAAYLMDLR